jgi:hypothetical protein
VQTKDSSCCGKAARECSAAIPPLPYAFMVCTGTTLTLYPETYKLYM